jgi:hypothetical protein
MATCSQIPVNRRVGRAESHGLAKVHQAQIERVSGEELCALGVTLPILAQARDLSEMAMGLV